MTAFPGLGIHFLLDLSEASFETLDDTALLEAAMRRCVEDMGAKVLGAHVHRLLPQGVSGVVVISESHLTIHTWPERGQAAIDLFTCGDPVRARAAILALAQALGAKKTRLREMHRGIAAE